MSLSKTLAIILGAGPGTGAALGRAFAKQHDVALLARSQASLDEIADQINKLGAGKASAFTCDASSSSSIDSALAAISAEFPSHKVKVAIFNVASPFVVKPFLDLTTAELETGLSINLLGAARFAQLALPKLLEAGGGDLIFSGATASLRGGAKFAAFAPSKFGLRGLAQSLAREFGPQGVHVSHTIIDGLIDTDRVKGFAGEQAAPDSRLDPDAIAEAYVFLANQPKSAWTQELDLRPYVEKF